jgi:hypothetical protein
MDAYMGGSASGLVTQVKARTRLVTPAGAGSADTTALQNAINDAATNGAPLSVRGAFSINGSLTVPSNADIETDLARITQTANLTPILVLTNVSGVRIRNPRFQGKTSDYVNNSGVYGAGAIRCMGTTSDVEIEGGSLLGIAGAGVYLAASTTGIKVRRVRMTGAGSAYILGTSYNYSGGIVTETGASKWEAIDNDISGFAQGIVTGDNMQDVRLALNYIHDIPGQHGMYLESVNGAVIIGNIVRNTALLGMKVQLGTTTVNDSDAVVINGNDFINVGAQGILLDNPQGGTPRHRRMSVIGNTVRTAAGVGIEVKGCVGVHVADNTLYDVAAGINVTGSSALELVDNKINKTKLNGITLTDVIDAIVDTNRIIDPASLDSASTEFGIHILGATSSDITVRDNKIADSAGHMRYGIYVQAGDLTTMDFLGNRVSGATDYGYRGIAANARSFRGNSFSGTTGSILTGPSNFTAIASPASDTSGTKAAIDAIRALLSANGFTP